MKPIEAKESFVDMHFPFKGIDVSTGYGMQQPSTAADGVNVRTFDPASQRARGGRRAGLVKYLPPRVGNLTSVIQELAVIVDPQAPGLGISFDDVPFPPIGTIDDPSDGGRNLIGDGLPGWIRDGGSGYHTPKEYERANPPIVLVIKPTDQYKAAGQVFTFTGSEWYLLEGQVDSQDSIDSVDLDSAGALAGAGAGDWTITASNAQMTINSGKLYSISYSTGIMKVAKCPWFANPAINVEVVIEYGELSGANTSVADPKTETKSWKVNTDFPIPGLQTGIVTSNQVPIDLGFGSSGRGVAVLEFLQIDPNPADPGQATQVKLRCTLSSLGLGIDPGRGDVLHGDVVQSETMLCSVFTDTNNTTEFHWLGEAFPSGPVGIVMGLDISVRYLGP